ncbi:MAG TPA: Zn-binding domain-containing protein, partial [Pseudonocardiaceae bacterium]
TYLVHNPKAMLDRPVEATVFDPANPYVLAPHLACAAAELPLTESCLEDFGGPAARKLVDELVAEQTLRRRPAGWYWTPRQLPHPGVDIRGSGGTQVAVVEADSGRMLGTVDPGAACWQVHPGAVYLHQGVSFVVDELDLDSGLALVHAEDPDWTTQPRDTVDISVVRVTERRDFDGVSTFLGDVDVTSQVVGYLRRLPTGEVLDQIPLVLPARTLRTRAVWYTIADRLLSGFAGGKHGSAPGGAGQIPARIPGALHAAEHAAIGLLPLFATCDRWDIGGVSTAAHTDTGEATVFVHDGHPGGAGFADRGFAALVPWLAATREAIFSCECPAGCPSCVQSPKCGNGNEPLDKAGAVAVLDIVLSALRDAEVDARHGDPVQTNVRSTPTR